MYQFNNNCKINNSLSYDIPYSWYQHTIHHAIKVFVGVYLSMFSTQISKEMSANQWFNAELEYHHLQLSWCSCSVQCQVSALKDLVSAALWLFTVTEVKCWFRRAVRREWCHSSPPRATQCCWLPETALPLVFALVCVRRLLMPTCHFLSFSWVIFPSSAPHVIETTLNGLPQPSLGAIQYCSDINLWWFQTPPSVSMLQWPYRHTVGSLLNRAPACQETLIMLQMG